MSSVDTSEVSSSLVASVGDSPLEGIRAGAVLRPEPLFHRKSRLIIDTHYSSEHNVLRNGLEQVEFQHINLISLDKLFNNKHETFLGFGVPNVYLTIPNETADGYIKFAAFMIWRQVSAIVDTKGRVQSGFLIRFRHLPAPALDKLRQAMQQHVNQRHVSCAFANACVLDTAGFTSGGTNLSNHFGARALFQQIYENGLEFGGEPLTLDFIRTTPLTLEEHFHQVRKKELTSLPRMIKKVVDECASSNDKVRAPLLQAEDIVTKPTTTGEVVAYTRLEISRPHRLGAMVRKFWGSHTLFRVVPGQRELNISTYLPETLRAFPVKNPDWFTRLKKYILFSRPVVMTIRAQMASIWDDHGAFSPGPLVSMMSIHTKSEPHPYNIVITGDHLIGMHSSPSLKLKIVDWILSKHVLISGYDDDVRFAGEAWMVHEDNGIVLHLTNNSGTYKPSNEHLKAAGQFVAAALPGLEIELHENTQPLPVVAKATADQASVFTLPNLLILVLAVAFWLVFVFFGGFKLV